MLNRARPKCVRSRAAKLHCGKSLFCARKPPKTELHSTISTYHQRAHIRNVKHDMFKPENNNQSLIISFGDKAYLRPGNDVGARDVKKGVIFDVADPQKHKQLPQHDFNSEPKGSPDTLLVQIYPRKCSKYWRRAKICTYWRPSCRNCPSKVLYWQFRKCVGLWSSENQICIISNWMKQVVIIEDKTVERL